MQGVVRRDESCMKMKTVIEQMSFLDSCTVEIMWDYKYKKFIGDVPISTSKNRPNLSSNIVGYVV